MAGDCGSEARVTHSGGMAVGDGLYEYGVGSDLIPVDVFEILLLQNGEQEAGHGIVAVRRHDGGFVSVLVDIDRGRGNGG